MMLANRLKPCRIGNLIRTGACCSLCHREIAHEVEGRVCRGIDARGILVNYHGNSLNGALTLNTRLTTITILFLTMLAFFKREKAPAVFKRRITTEAIYGAVAVFMLDVMLAVLGSMFIAKIEQTAFLKALFESASAVGTVGLSMGITPALHTVSKYILIILMYTGRVGGLTLVFAAITRKSTGNRQYPADNIAVG